jgi:predicted transcriptional regulator
MRENRNDDGQFEAEHSDSDVLSAVDANTPAATSEVADDLGISRQAADYRLRQLRDEERVEAKKIGASLVWFTTDSESA